MFELQQTEVFRAFVERLSDDIAAAAIAARLLRLARGNWGDCKPIAGGVVELRIHHGPGYRIYCKRSGKVVIVLLCAGTKSTQKYDIKQALILVAELEKKK